jgi:hypothetical protein
MTRRFTATVVGARTSALLGTPVTAFVRTSSTRPIRRDSERNRTPDKPTVRLRVDKVPTQASGSVWTWPLRWLPRQIPKVVRPSHLRPEAWDRDRLASSESNRLSDLAKLDTGGLAWGVAVPNVCVQSRASSHVGCSALLGRYLRSSNLQQLRKHDPNQIENPPYF